MFAEWWAKCGMRILDFNCRSEDVVNLQSTDSAIP